MTVILTRTSGPTDETPAPTTGEGNAAAARRLRRGLLVAAPLALVGTVVLLLLAGGASYWRFIAAEDTPMTWLQSVVLMLAAASAALLAALSSLRGRGGTRSWLLLAAGFAVLALDDRFALHERLRDRLLSKIDVALPWGAPGDYVLLLVAVLGLAALPRLLRVVGAHRLSRGLFFAAIGTTLLALGMDSVDPESLSIDAERFEQTFEEVVELTGATLFLLALALRLVDEVAQP